MNKADIDKFYTENSIADWRTVLGPRMHYHFGLFRPGVTDVSDEEMDVATDRAIRVLYPHIPEGSSVLDIGCGWGGPCGLLTEERDCNVIGLTISRGQAEYCRKLGMDVIHGDAEDERTEFPGEVDVVLMMESLMHMVDKEKLLRRLRGCASKLVIRTHCGRVRQDSAFAGTAYIVTPEGLETTLRNAGWNIDVWFDRRIESMQSVRAWQMRLKRLDRETVTGQLELLRRWCAHVLSNPRKWAHSHPLFEVIAT
jgi:SAM-dependent methyltransferase